MTTQTEAERLADALTTAVKQIDEDDQVVHVARWFVEDSATELRRLVSFNNDLMDEVARLQKREWVGLTDEERNAINLHNVYVSDIIGATEAKLKEKNAK